MTDPHEKEWLDLPEINRQDIEDNKYSILQNRIMVVSLFILAIVINVGTYLVNKHDLHDCETTLYNKLMKDIKDDV